LATVVAAPLGSYLGALIGWRGAFLCLAPVALLALLWQAVSLPAMRPAVRHTAPTHPLALLATPLVALGMAGVSLLFMGQFTLFTYLRPFLESETRVQVQTLSLILLAIGVAGFIGTTLIGRLLRRWFYGTLVFIPLLMAVIALVLVACGHHVLPVSLLLALWGLVATAAPVGWWSWVARTLPQDAEAGGGLMVALVQLAIGLGSTLGGLLFDHGGHHLTFFASAGVLLAAALLAALTARQDRGPSSNERTNS
jgi:predicted MFS family arabinose efflux permease